MEDGLTLTDYTESHFYFFLRYELVTRGFFFLILLNFLIETGGDWRLEFYSGLRVFSVLA